MLRWRLLLGTLFIAAIAGFCWADFRLEAATGVPGLGLLPVLVVLVVLATSEVLGLAAAAGVQPAAWAAQAGALLIALSSWAAPLGDGLARLSATAGVADSAGASAGSEWTFLATGLAVILVLVAEMARYRAPGGATAAVATSVFAAIYVGVLMAFAVQLRMHWGLAALASMLIVVKLSDIGAYTVGRLIGRHKMSPVISPGKTLEGAAGAIVFACLASWLTSLVVAGEGGNAGRAVGWIAYGALVAVAGMAGDLGESLLKRDVGRKDSSAWMPGFGGVLDMVDSVLLAAPIAYACWRFGLVGR